jgi:hypothetical protein
MRKSTLHGIILSSMLAATGCGAFAARTEPSHNAGGSAWDLDAGAATGVRPAMAQAPEADALFIAPLRLSDTINLAPGALLDVWLNDPRKDLRTLSRERSMGAAVVRGDFFRYNSISLDPDLRGYWGQPLLLKWSAILEITEPGVHVFESELSKERGWGAMVVRTLVTLNQETLFDKEVRVFGSNQIFEMGSRTLSLAPGRYTLEVWLAAENRLRLPPETRLGTFLKIRAPSLRTGQPIQSSQLWHVVP